ncbi:sigma-70 family RNA polymerase sigma factor [Actinoplanes sp. NPDC049596]|uniref:RNA polymerase sigma factor n=1 Tax=unclassified Actinoplanes TaxID=2626549 RepID=UPI003431BAC7
MNDAELLSCVQGGEAAALGVLLERHEAGMRAVALSLLGYGPDAEDAVQDAMITAIRRIGDLRDRAAAGSWLRAVVRNNCRMRLRDRRAVPVADPEFFQVPTGEPGPEELLEQVTTRDWVWHAIDGLSEVDRLVVLARYFSSVTSYDQIARMCDVPVGTVRSRLSHARRTLVASLRATAGQQHPDSAAHAEARRREAADAMAAAMRGDFHQVVDDLWWPQAEFVARSPGLRGGVDLALSGMNGDLESGVRQRLLSVVAGKNVLIWETELQSPASDPGHCPPTAVWLHTLRQGRVSSITLFHPEISPD